MSTETEKLLSERLIQRFADEADRLDSLAPYGKNRAAREVLIEKAKAFRHAIEIIKEETEKSTT